MLQKRSDRPLMFVQVLSEEPSCGLSCLGSFVPAGWFARHVPLHKLQVAGIRRALQICGDALSHSANIWSVRQLIPESRFRLMEAPIGMPQSQKTVVGRPIKWAQCGGFFPLLGCEPCLRGNDNFQSSAIRSQWLETSHHVWFNEPCCISMDELLETSSHLKVFIQTKAENQACFWQQI